MPLNIRVRINPEFKRSLEALDAAWEQLERQGFALGASGDHRMLEEIAGFEALQSEQVFSTQGQAHKAGPWAPLSDRYRRWKQTVRPGRKILRFDGPLMDSFRHLSNKHHIARVRGGRIEMGSDHPLAVVHHEGDRETHQVRGYTYRRKDGAEISVRAHQRRANLPARKIVAKSEAQRTNLKLAAARAYLQWLGERTRGSIRTQLAQIAIRVREPNAKAS